MSIGALLIGLAAFILTVAYVAAPFRQVSRQAELDAQIEAWVADARKSGVASEPTVATAAKITAPIGDRPPPVLVDKPANYCHQCGEPVQPDHWFCRNCGARLLADGR